MVRDMSSCDLPARTDTAEEKRVELCEKIKERFKLERDDSELAANEAACSPEYKSPLANDDPAKHGG